MSAAVGFLEPRDDLPDLLLAYQIEGIELSHANPLFVSEKSRRTGLTFGFAADAVLTAAPSIGAQNFYYIAYNKDMTREFIGYCADFAKAFNLIAPTCSEFLFDDGSEKGINAFRIDFPSGKSIVALSSRPRSLRGMQGVVLIDEAAFHDQFKELLDAAMALTMWGGRIIVISTHNGADSEFNTLIEDIRSGKREGVVQRVPLKAALRQGLFKRICLVTGQVWSPEAEAIWEASLRKRYGEASEQELDAIPARGSGIYLARATIELAMSYELPVIRLACPDGFERREDEFRTNWITEFLEREVAPWLLDFDPNRTTYFGQDFARSGDVSPVVFGQRDEKMRRVARFLLEMRNVPFKDQELILNWILSRVPMFACGKMDARGNGSALAEAMQQRWGFDRVEAVQTSEKTYLAFMPKLRSAIEDRMLLIPWDEGVMDDLRMIKLVRGIPMIPDRGKVSKVDGDSGKRHGDDAIALMHFVAASDEDIGPIEFFSAGQRSTHLAAGPVSTRGFGSAGARAGFVR
jgi:phage FluMu gp28-like protein